MLEVLVAQYPLSDVWALPGVRAGGNQMVWKGLGRCGQLRAGCPAEKGGTQAGDTALSEEVPLPFLQSICLRGCAVSGAGRAVVLLQTPTLTHCLLLLPHGFSSHMSFM